MKNVKNVIIIETEKGTACERGYYPDNTGDICILFPNCITADNTAKAYTTYKPGCYKSTDGKTYTMNIKM